MDNTAVMKKIHKFVASRYMHNIVSAELGKITLFPIFSQTGAANISEGKSFLMVNDLKKLAILMGANILN